MLPYYGNFFQKVIWIRYCEHEHNLRQFWRSTLCTKVLKSVSVILPHFSKLKNIMHSLRVTKHKIWCDNFLDFSDKSTLLDRNISGVESSNESRLREGVLQNEKLVFGNNVGPRFENRFRANWGQVQATEVPQSQLTMMVLNWEETVFVTILLWKV